MILILFTELASKVIWVLPNATKITTKGYGVVGSVFAPNAVVDKGWLY